MALHDLKYDLKDREIASLRMDAARTRERFSKLCEVVARASLQTDREHLLAELAAGLSELCDAQYSAVALFDDEGEINEFVPCGIPQEDADRIGRSPRGMGLLGWLREQSGPVRLADIGEHPRSIGFPDHHPNMTSLIGAPLQAEAGTVGILMAADKKQGKAFTEEDEQLLGLFATHAAAAIDSVGWRTRLTQRGDGDNTEEHFAAAFDYALDAVLIADDAERIVEANAAVCHLLGRPRDKLVGSTIQGVTGAGNDAIWESLLANGTFTGDVTLTKSNGEGVEAEFRAVAGFAPGLHLFVIRDITARKQMEAALKESRERFSRLFYDSPIAIAITRLDDDTFVDANDAYCRLTGYRREEIIGGSAQDFGLEVDPERRARMAHALKSRGAVHDWQLLLPSKEGQQRNVRLAAEIMELDGEDHVVSFLEDVTEQRRAAADRERLAAIVDSTDDAIFSVTTDGRVLTWNQGARRIFGYAAEEAVGSMLPDLLRAPRSVHEIESAFTGEGPSVRTEMELVRKDGTPVFVALTSSRMLDRNGKVVAVCGIARDITAQKRAERTRDVERERLKTLMETSPAGMFVVDAIGERVLMFNREFERVMGMEYHAGQSLDTDRDLLVFRRPDGSAYAPEELPLQRAIQRGERVQAEEVSIQRGDGSTVLTLMSATPIYDLDGRITTGVLVVDDITPLEEVDRLRNDFLGMVSHELRSPLAIIKTAVEWTRSGQAEPGSSEDVPVDAIETIERQTERLLSMVDNLLDMTQIEAGVFNVIARPTDIETVLGEVQSNFQRRGVTTLTVEVPQGLPKVNMDRRRILQVLENLVNNALAHSRPDTPIRVRVEPEDMHVTVHVHNEGPGISAEQIPYLFKKFSMAGNRSRRAGIGVGLGLAICKGIVEAHGGRIWVNSSVDRGETTFSFTLAMASQQVVDERPLMVTERAHHVGRVRRPGERTRILAVDDEPQMLRYLQRTLGSAGYHPIVTKDPTQAARLIEAEDPDLVLLDMLFPGGDGFKVLEEIREVSGIPVLFLSAVDGDAIVKALQAGADDYITKPFSASELLARVEASLRRRVLPDQFEVRPPYKADSLVIDFNDRRVSVDNIPVSLSATEYKLLFELAGNAGRVLTNQELLRRIWGPEYSGESHLLRSFVRNLRRKLKDDARSPKLIFTERGIGYRMRRA